VDAIFFFWPLLIAWGSLRQMRRSLPVSSLDEYALTHYGSEFLAVEERARALAFLEFERDEGLREDEHEATLVGRSKEIAYRILRPCLILLIGVYLWVVCRQQPLARPQVMFQITADTGIWLALMALVLPTMVRAWTQPDNPAEPMLVAAAQKEA